MNTRIHSKQCVTISIEEGMDCRETDSRFFSLTNHDTKLNIIISKTSTILSCKLHDHEIVVDRKLYNQTHETCAIGDRPFQKISSLPWNCHVRGAELFLSTSNSTSSIMYELTKTNELDSVVRLKNIHIQNQVSYFNLNKASEKVPIDGHTLVVQCNGNMKRIQAQSTKLLCHCNKRLSVLPQSLIGDIPFELVQQGELESVNYVGTEDDLIVCDAIYSLQVNCPLDFIRVQLQYNTRVLVFEVRSTPRVAQSNLNSCSNVSSSTNKHASAQTMEGNCSTQQASSSSADIYDASSESDLLDVKPQVEWLSSLVDSQASSYQVSNMETKNSNVSDSTGSTTSSSQTGTLLRVRIRITNFGICIMPIMMTSYSCTYRFAW